MAILAAEKLVQEGYDFSLTMVGGGEMEEMLMQMTEEKHLSEYVTFAGFKKPERRHRKEAEIPQQTTHGSALSGGSRRTGCQVPVFRYRMQLGRQAP